PQTPAAPPTPPPLPPVPVPRVPAAPPLPPPASTGGGGPMIGATSTCELRLAAVAASRFTPPTTYMYGPDTSATIERRGLLSALVVAHEPSDPSGLIGAFHTSGSSLDAG